MPVSQLAYSNLPKSKNNKASSLTNLFRNQGGSFGIAFVTTLLARRTQYHQSVLVGHVTPYAERYRQLLGNLTGYFAAHGYAQADAVVHAQAQAFSLIERQASFQGFLDCFTALGWMVLMGVPLVFLIKKFKASEFGESLKRKPPTPKGESGALRRRWALWRLVEVEILHCASLTTRLFVPLTVGTGRVTIRFGVR